jgi:hypothetical protein
LDNTIEKQLVTKKIYLVLNIKNNITSASPSYLKFEKIIKTSSAILSPFLINSITFGKILISQNAGIDFNQIA